MHKTRKRRNAKEEEATQCIRRGSDAEEEDANVTDEEATQHKKTRKKLPFPIEVICKKEKDFVKLLLFFNHYMFLSKYQHQKITYQKDLNLDES